MLFFFVGLLASLIGVGGGVFFVPILLAMGYPPDVAVGTSSIAVAFTTTIGGIGYYREGFYDKEITLKVLLFAYPGVFLGVMLSVNVPAIVKPAIGALLIIAGYRAFRRFMVPQRLQMPGFFLAGLAIGLLGIGGGVILTPLIVSTSSYDLVYSIGVAYTTKPLLTIPSAILHALYGKADIRAGVCIGIFSSMGAYSGSKIAGKFKRSLLFKRVIGALMIITGAYIVIRALVRERYNTGPSYESMDIEELRSLIREARKEFLDGKMTLTDERLSLVHITQILTYVDLSTEAYKELVEEYREDVRRMLSCEEPSKDLASVGIGKRVNGIVLPKNSLVIQAAKVIGIEPCETLRDPKNMAVLDLSYALDSLRIPNEVRLVDGDVKIYVKGRRIRTIMVGIAQPEKAFGRSGEDIVKLRSYIPRFLSGSLGRKLLPIIIDLGLSEAIKNIPIIYLPIGILSILAFYKQNIPAISIYAPVYKKIQNLIA